MKSIRGFLIGMVITGSLAAGLHFLHAQTAVVGGFNGGITPVQPVADSIVQLTADAQGLALVPPDQVPRTGTFWVILPGPNGGAIPPYPCPPLDPSLPIYAIDAVADGQFLVDGTVGGEATLNTQQAGRLAASSTSLAFLEAQATAVVNLITRIQTATANQQMRTMARAMGMDVPSFNDTGDGGDGTNGFYSDSFNYTMPTNGLFLEMTGVTNGLAYVNLHCIPSLDSVYEIYSRTDLSSSSWNIETEVFPPDTNQNVVAFTVPELNRTNLFLWARDWTGVTNNGNETPEWWFWKFFGAVDLSDTNLDSQGNTLLYDYQKGLDPNIIEFSLQFTNNYFNTSPVNGTISIFEGAPFYMAVLINDTNFADANWQPYNSNIVVSLNSGNGIYNVLVGLRGLPADATQTWMGKQLTLDNIAPMFVITNPVSSTVSVPMIQLQGFVSVSLSTLTFDVSNALGVVTNQQGYWNPVFYDTNALDFTTNAFQCYDIPLTNGLNTITLHATDVAGNSTTTNVSFTLDYSGDTTPATLNILWPQNGTQICDSNFALQARMDDDTATVMAQIVDANGNTNTVQGLVERSGLVWAQNLPLAAGTNILTVTATDAAGNSASTNLTLVQSSVTVTMDPLSSDQANQSSVTVTGTINDPSGDVCIKVNGTSAYYLDDIGDWEADNVLVSPVGTATFDVELYTNDPVNIGSQNFSQLQPAVLALMSYTKQIHRKVTYYGYCLDGPAPYQAGDGVNWLYQSGGMDSSADSGIGGDCTPVSFSGTTSLAGGYNAFSPTWECADVTENLDWNYGGGLTSAGTQETDAKTRVMIVPSGQQFIGQMALYLVQAQVMDEDTGLQLVAGAVQFVNQLAGTATEDVTNSDGSVWTEAVVSGASGAQVEVTPQAARNYSYTGMKLSKLVYISVDTSGESSSFHASDVQMNLQSQLTTNVFDSLPTGQGVQVMVRENSSYGGTLGWNSPKQTYVTRVKWGEPPYDGWEYSQDNETTISLIRIEAAFAGLGNFEGTQFWVNSLAHESIWSNAGGQRDHTAGIPFPLPNPQPDGDISSGHVNPTSRYSVSDWSHSTIRSAFGF